MSQYDRVNRCPIDVYVASNMPYEYPYKLVKPEHVTKSVVNSAETVIMDSGIGDDVDNSRVLDLAGQYDTDFVVAKDYLHDQSRTTSSIRDFLTLWEKHDCRATPLIPLQPPHNEHYTEFPKQYHYLLGGMAFDYNTNQIISAVESFRSEAGDAPYIHLLGVGVNPRLMDYLGNNPDMVQAIDCSTPEQCAINGRIYDTSLRQMGYDLRSGKGSSKGRYMLAQHLSYVLNDAIAMRHDQTNTLAAYCE